MMWYQQYTMYPQRRVPVVHEQIAMQCARSIMRVAAALPQPPSRYPSGYVPILVELRRTDESTVYRYQVNVPPWVWSPEQGPSSAVVGSGSDTDLQVLMLSDSTESLVPRLPDIPPCPMHGHSGLDTIPVAAPPLVMSQSFVHVVNSANSPFVPAIISTCSAPAVVGKMAQPVQEHFVPTLFEEQLPYSNNWLPEDPKAVTPSVSDSASDSASASAVYSTPASSPISVSPRRPQDVPSLPRRFPQLLFLDENDEYVAYKEERPKNGHRTEVPRTRSEWARIPELCLDSNGEYVLNQLLQRPLNGHRPRSNPVEQHPRQQHQQHQQQQQQQQHQQQQLQQLQQQPPVHLPKGLNGLNGLNGYKGLNGYSPHLNGHHKNGYKAADQRMAYTDQDKVMRLRFQEQVESWSNRMSAQREVVDQRMERLMALMPKEPIEPLPNVTDVVVPAEALGQPHGYREPPTFFRWNYCTLCHTAMRTVRNSVDHYTSRAHERRVSTFLGRLRFDKNLGSGASLLDILALPEQVLHYLHRDRPSDLYCDLCDLRLTSIIHAEQHFFGRRHRQMERQVSEPSHYGIKTHWMRKDTKLLMCELCDVSITSESQMAMHISGVRHRKRAHIARVRGAFGLGPVPVDGSHMFEINNNGTLAPLRPQGTGSIQFRPWGDPSAAYYCEACNVTLNHLKSVKQHENGRMHQRNLMRLPHQ